MAVATVPGSFYRSTERQLLLFNASVVDDSDEPDWSLSEHTRRVGKTHIALIRAQLRARRQQAETPDLLDDKEPDYHRDPD